MAGIFGFGATSRPRLRAAMVMGISLARPVSAEITVVPAAGIWFGLAKAELIKATGTVPKVTSEPSRALAAKPFSESLLGASNVTGAG